MIATSRREPLTGGLSLPSQPAQLLLQGGDSPVALDIVDPDDPFRYLAVRGRVVDATEEGAAEHIDTLARRYMGLERYPRHDPNRPRRLYRIVPERVVAQSRIGEVR